MDPIEPIGIGVWKCEPLPCALSFFDSKREIGMLRRRDEEEKKRKRAAMREENREGVRYHRLPQIYTLGGEDARGRLVTCAYA